MERAGVLNVYCLPSFCDDLRTLFVKTKLQTRFHGKNVKVKTNLFKLECRALGDLFAPRPVARWPVDALLVLYMGVQKPKSSPLGPVQHQALWRTHIDGQRNKPWCENPKKDRD